MSFFFPNLLFKRAYDITPEFLKKSNIKALLLDVDNTLTGHGSQELPAEISAWLLAMQDAGIKMAIVSNNVEKRVMPFAKKINLEYKSFCCKPSPIGLIKARKILGVQKNEIALVGDQIFTDVLAANFYGIKSYLVVPMYSDYKWTIRFKRYLEKRILNLYYKKGGKIIEKSN